jgi:hypothetical protein
MDKASERLFRSTLHDLANTLAGMRGILDLTPPDQALGARNHARMDAVVSEGLTMLARARHLALATFPDAGLQEGPDWRAQVQDEAASLVSLFRHPVTVEAEPGDGSDLWPGALGRDLVLAVARQVLPYVKEGSLAVRCLPRKEAWFLAFAPVPFMPDNLLPAPEDARRDLSSLWGRRLLDHLQADLSVENGILTIRIPRA